MSNDLKFVKIIRGDGAAFQFGDTFIETEIEGAGTITREIFSQPRGLGIGNIKTGARLPPRSLIIRSQSIGGSANDSNRRIVDSFFNDPEEAYRIEVTYKGVTRWIRGEIEVYHLPIDYVGAPQVFELELLCLDPLFRSMDEFGRDIAHITPMFGWPAFYPSEMPDSKNAGGAIYGVYDFTRRVALKNEGDYPTKPHVTVTASDTVENFELVKSAAEYIKVIDTMQNGDVYAIDFENETITKNGVNINRLLDKNSSYFTIEKGGIEVQYNAAIGENSVAVSVYYNQLFKGL